MVFSSLFAFGFIFYFIFYNSLKVFFLIWNGPIVSPQYFWCPRNRNHKFPLIPPSASTECMTSPFGSLTQLSRDPFNSHLAVQSSPLQDYQALIGCTWHCYATTHLKRKAFFLYEIMQSAHHSSVCIRPFSQMTCVFFIIIFAIWYEKCVYVPREIIAAIFWEGEWLET